ncbi:MAG: hypothetical protein KDG54_07480 [Geminicoccaceae bacterium]|nr:hypothetical protein [Geminicoccaceae bacterium]
MTIGIAAAGKGAGLGVFRALAAVEKVGRGAIGGFVSMAAITGDGRLLRAETQRGGTLTLFTEGETTGTLPPDDIALAPFAVVMSSGPDRPHPLAQFTPGDPLAGLVTGHRLPNMPGAGGKIPNLEVLERLRAGADARSAVNEVLAAMPDADAGVVAIDLSGWIHLGNTDFTATRGDLGQALMEAPHGRAAVLHNAIHPHRGLAELAAATALDAMAPGDRSDFDVTFNGNVPLELGPANVALIDDEGRIAMIRVTQASWLGTTFEGAAINFNAAICRNETLLGHAVSEPYCVARNRHVISMSGSSHARIGVRAIRPSSPG